MKLLSLLVLQLTLTLSVLCFEFAFAGSLPSTSGSVTSSTCSTLPSSQRQRKHRQLSQPQSSLSIMANTQASAIDSSDAKAKLMAPRGGAGRPAKEEETFSRLVTLRRTIFPIYGRQEVIKFLLIGAIKFFIILALTLTRDTKDTLVVTQCGAEAIAFLKVR